MTLVKYRPGRMRRNLGFSTMMDEFLGRDISQFIGHDQSQFNPSVNVSESSDGFEIQVAAPGFDKNNFNVNVEDKVLTISGEVKTEDNADTVNYTRREFHQASFSRSFTLPESINKDKIKANYNNGILALTLPKMEEQKGDKVKQIKIS